MTKLMTYDLAKREVERLTQYISLIEGYQTDTREKMIIKAYAMTNSMPKVVKKLEYLGVTKDMVKEVITSKPQDELHKMVRSGYMLKTRQARKKFVY